MIDSAAGPDAANLDDAGVAEAAARAGAAVVRARFGQELARIDKGGGDFATSADIEAEAAILGVLRAARPADAVVGEEGGRQGAAGAARQWLVDPLCGTLNHPVGNMRAAYVTDGGDLAGSVHFVAGIALCRAAGCVVT